MPAAYIHTSWMYYMKHALLISALMGCCFYLFGYVNFLKMPSERSGHFILSKHIERTIQVLVMVLSMLGSAGYADMLITVRIPVTYSACLSARLSGFSSVITSSIKNETDIRGVVYVIEVQHIDHSFKIGRKGRESEVPVLKDVSLTVEKGKLPVSSVGAVPENQRF